MTEQSPPTPDLILTTLQDREAALLTELNASIQAAIPDAAERKLTKTRKIINSVKTELTEEEIVAYVIEGMKRDHKELKDYEMVVDFDRVDEGDDLRLVATVSGEKVA